MAQTEKLTVFYDGACPLCEREIGFYRGCRGAEEIAWVDVSQADSGDVTPGLSQDAAMKRFHVQKADGGLVSGGAAFAELWATLPSFRWAGALLRQRPFVPVLDLSYNGFLKLRPRLQSLVRRRVATQKDALPKWLLQELRSDHAGETGAVAIYRGILAISRDPELRTFAEAHRETEQQHLELMEDLLAPRERSVFLPLWRLAGFITGALPALFGPPAVYATIEAVETFVDTHYAAQVTRLAREGTHPEILEILERCRLDEVHHRDEAREALLATPGFVVRVWQKLVGAGSGAAVALARRA